MALRGESTDRTRTVNVLVVDDEPDAATIIARHLERADERIDVTTETDPEAGLATARDDEFDCIVSDYHMPGMDGLSFLERVDEVSEDVERILHTTDDTSWVREAARKADVRFVEKKISTDVYEQMATQIRDRVGA